MARLTIEALRERFSAKGRTLGCPACGGSELAASVSKDGKPLALLYEDHPVSWFGSPGYLRVFAFTCVDCSHVLVFDADRILGDTSPR
ncbi:hypothetical protein [Chthonobacter albigriseus]|uniref:hypothetical protein n=1 Tax=Chthonobacter albigriseus TaxID=1683161 RepID=UPI0015EF5769|nr:hypothetical protein [Chthonobacter albigriseus]